MPQTRRSFWTRTFAAARESGGWYRVNRHYTRATAVQIASDISCAHTRDPDRHRMRGINLGEQWEARWEPAVDGAPSDLVVWIRLVAVDGVAMVRHTPARDLIAPLPAHDGAAHDGAAHDGAVHDGAAHDGARAAGIMAASRPFTVPRSGDDPGAGDHDGTAHLDGTAHHDGITHHDGADRTG